jgi:hypothetical protein
VRVNSTEDYKVYNGECGVCADSVAIIAITEIYEVSLNTYVVFLGQITQPPTVINNEAATERKCFVLFNDKEGNK